MPLSIVFVDHHLSDGLSISKAVSATCLDLSKSFDKIQHNRIINSYLRDQGINLAVTFVSDKSSAESCSRQHVQSFFAVKSGVSHQGSSSDLFLRSILGVHSAHRNTQRKANKVCHDSYWKAKPRHTNSQSGEHHELPQRQTPHFKQRKK